MAFSQWADDQLFFVAETSGTDTDIGSVQFSSIKELSYVRLTFLKKGTEGGSETLQLQFYTDSTLTKLYASSDVVTISDFVSGTYWLGWVRFDMSSTPIFAANTSYYMTVKTTNYTRNSDTYYLAFGLDWPAPRNVIAATPVAYTEFYERA